MGKPHYQLQSMIFQSPTTAQVNVTTIRALPPCPPNWKKNFEDTVASMLTHRLFEVNYSTPEFAMIATLLNQVEISKVEQIVNPALWSRFINTRKDMIKLKSEDMPTLSRLGCDDTEIARMTFSTLHFTKAPAVAAIPYSDNMALLFHCTKRSTNIDNILREGLDERMGIGGLLGRGIYFTDNPFKARKYDGCGGIMFVFAVLLGDCLSVKHIHHVNGLVREPSKLPEQKRNFNDLFFDSIAGQPGSGRYNEYVVYNRNQCYPLYKITYPKLQDERIRSDDTTGDVYSIYRKKIPPFTWAASTGTAMPNESNVWPAWPFYASTIFDQMGVQEEPEKNETGANLPSNSDNPVPMDWE